MFAFLPLESSVLVVYCMCSNLYLTHVVVVVFSFSSLADINHIVEKRNTDATSVVVVVVAIFLYFLRRFIGVFWALVQIKPFIRCNVSIFRPYYLIY